MKPTGATKGWMLSKPLTNQIISDDLRRGLTGSIAIHCIDIPEDGSDRIHFAAVVVFGDEQRAGDIITAINERERLRAAIQKFVNAYSNGKEARLGNGQARRSLDEFRQLLNDATTSTSAGGND